MKNKVSLGFIGFLQALTLVSYVSLVAFMMWRSEQWFKEPIGFLGIILVLTLFATSALISSIITLGYPVFLVWKKKEIINAIKLVIYTSLWLFVLIGLIGITLLII